MSRVMCYKCYWPQPLCWCASITPMPSRTKFVFLMHPYEFKRIKANTGRLTHLCLADSELHIGISFDEHDKVQALINDPQNYPVLLYPSREARDLSKGELHAEDFAGKRLVVFLLDATWRLVRPMLRTSLTLQRLPCIMFSNAAPSRYVIKRQPEPGCLSTLEATHELLLALDRSGLDHYAQPTQLLEVFQRMQDFQIRCTAENKRLGISRYTRRTRPEGPPMPRPEPKRRRIFPKPPQNSPDLSA
ncbi:tRNA-uridine aminocarboxypropyltransferase [Oleiharenicola lentus]|uniref:tRNA-uridine aminocarboxypropyltransferase n=1 Tax=Oleiharenicola lentus TaxID=2508720 RepID=UPI003F67FE4E